MSNFLSSLGTSIFTPGVTPTLLIATNATFAALQALLFALLLATSSYHFAILSVICGGLWYGINWFVTELLAMKAEQAEEEERKRKVGGLGEEDDGETTEGEVEREVREAMGEGTGTDRKGGKAELRQRKEEVVGVGDVSGTDSEWEKVSQEGDR